MIWFPRSKRSEDLLALVTYDFVRIFRTRKILRCEKNRLTLTKKMIHIKIKLRGDPLKHVFSYYPSKLEDH